MLHADRITKRLGERTLLAGVSMTAWPGEIVAVVGAPGAGKTTLLELFLGFDAPDSGNLAVAGLDPVREPLAARQRVAYVPAKVRLYDEFSGGENLHYFCALAGQRLPRAAVTAALRRAGLPDDWHERRFGDYPPPLRRKTAFAIAFSRRCNALLLDEPFGDLDEATRAELAEALRRFRKRGTAILLATRDLAFAQRLATRVVLLERGAVVETLDPQMSRRSHAAESYLTALVG